ncbi:hypothetical protein NLU13_9355 [Sarocladium strictum]|uniref:Alb1-domain-containing protein n=1 Tax=Sarocladium strictum TaxID=5046 RepID=A0AA39GAK2_SARSR|nr:hypothetical protein NLU13_9355 [Sarocladium strictum]
MAKKRTVSKHSRAARRATSLDIDVDKSLKEVQPPAPTKHRPSVLAAHQSAGVTKKVKPSRRSHMSSKARKRHERGLEMAEAVIERTSKKKQKSFARSRNIQERAKAWEEINKDAEAMEAEAEEGRKTRTVFNAAHAEDEAWETDEDKPFAGETVALDAAAAKATEVRDDDDDVIL